MLVNNKLKIYPVSYTHLKGINAGNLKVANVADGVADKDAVNVSQLKKVDDKAEANKTAIDTNKTAIEMCIRDSY